ncbi:plasmid maintenance system killer family protein, partial [Candidatus Magnetomorum sp. HK-1]
MDSYSIRFLGEKRSRLFKARLDDMHAAETLEDLKHIPGRYHELKHNRKGQWSC